MQYIDFDRKQKGHFNGSIGTFIDNKIRKEQIWCAEQIFDEYYDLLTENHKKGWFGGREYHDGVETAPYEEIEKWMETDEAKAIVMSKIEKQLQQAKVKKIARSKSPLTKRIRLGYFWDKNNYYDIIFGVQERISDKISQEELSSLPYKPWTVAHVETILKNKYSKDLLSVLNELSLSPIEIQFYKKWVSDYYSNPNNPALLPEISGSQIKIYCYKDPNGVYYSDYKEGRIPVNVRYDFGVINYEKQTMILIELDGHDYHEAKPDRINDSIKRTIGVNDGWQVLVFTGTQVYSRPQETFDSITNFLEV